MRSADADSGEPSAVDDSVAVTTRSDTPRGYSCGAERPLQENREDERPHLRDVRLLIEARKVRCRRHREPEFLPEHLAVALQHFECRAENAIGEHDAAVVGQQDMCGIDRTVGEAARPRMQRCDGVDDERRELDRDRLGNHFAGRLEMREQVRQPDAGRYLADDVQRAARAFHAADRRERSNVEIRVAGSAAANGLFDNRLGGQRRRELEDLGVCAAADLYPADAESIIQRIWFSRDRSSDHGRADCNRRSGERWANSPANSPFFVYDVPFTLQIGCTCYTSSRSP